MKHRLKEIELQTAKLEKLRSEREQRIREAHEAGASLRELAGAARVSYETVRRMISADSS